MSPQPPTPKLPSRRQAAEAMREFNQLGPDLPRMRESVFREFLQRLYNPATDTFDIGFWIETFKTQQRPVVITDDYDQKLFICPPLTGTVETMLGGGIGRGAQHAELLDKRHGQLGENQRVQILKDTEKQLKELNPREVWRHILIRYQIVGSGKGTSSASQAPGSSDLQDAFLSADDEPA